MAGADAEALRFMELAVMGLSGTVVAMGGYIAKLHIDALKAAREDREADKDIAEGMRLLHDMLADKEKKA